MILFGKKAEIAKIATTILDVAEDGIVVINQQHRIIYFNAGARLMFGYSEKEVLGEHLDIIIPERFHVQHDAMIEEFSSGNTSVKHMGQRGRQIFAKRKDGNEFVASVAIAKIDAGGQHYYAATVRDISENKKTEEELLRLAATDPLTGAFNRREFTAIADREALRAQRYNHALSILMLDLDHFKKLNDTYGHAAGDKVLQKFTALCCNALRNVDVFGRWGGEEFVILLPETPAEGAAIIGERLRKEVCDTPFMYNEQKMPVTVSIGIAQYKNGETSIETPLARADSAVYDAKKAGRNRISIYRN